MFASYQSWFKGNRPSILEDFYTFLRFPTISSDPSHKKEMALCTSWLASYLKKMNMDVEVWETSGHPSVFASHLTGEEDAPTLLFYGHYDVQPVAPRKEWRTPPFEPQLREGKVYARGSVDNKGQGFYTILGIRAFLELSESSRLNIKVLIEGEEEVGSPGLEGILKDKKHALSADHVFIVDLDMYEENIPAVTLGIRGLATLNVTVRNAPVNVHSGMYGGVLVNPAQALTAAVGKMWDAAGNVTIPHFYDGMKTFSKEELESFDWTLDLKKIAHSLGAKALQQKGGRSLLESNWIRPTLEINGMHSGYTEEGFQTIIPSQATAHFSCRLVEGQNPDRVIKAIKSFLTCNLPEELEIEFEGERGTEGLVTSPYSKTARCTITAYERLFQTRCRPVLCGATIPIVPMLSQVCGGEIVMIGLGLPSDGMHAPNESFGLDRFEKGFLSITQILEIFSKG